jgi:hypothetical protein
MTTTSSIYDLASGEAICEGLQGSRVCDAAIRAAERWADELGRDILLADDDGEWIVHPAREDGTRQPADPRIQSEVSRG